MDASIIGATPLRCVICHDFVQHDKRIPSWVELIPSEYPQICLDTQGRMNAVRNVFYGWSNVVTGDSCANPKCRGTRFLVPKITAAYWNQKGRFNQEFRDSVTIEWESNDWTIWRFGECDKSDLLKRVARSAKRSKNDAEITLAERYIDESDAELGSIIGKAWQNTSEHQSFRLIQLDDVTC